MMKDHFQFSDKAFEAHFAQCTFPAELFSHEAHLRLAWIHINNYGLNQAIENICSQLKAFVKGVGAEDKYNETLTIAATRAVYHFMLKSETTNFADFISENPRLKHNLKDLMSAHYETDIFNSAIAKKIYLEPELLPFD